MINMPYIKPLNLPYEVSLVQAITYLYIILTCHSKVIYLIPSYKLLTMANDYRNSALRVVQVVTRVCLRN